MSPSFESRFQLVAGYLFVGVAFRLALIPGMNWFWYSGTSIGPETELGFWVVFCVFWLGIATGVLWWAHMMISAAITRDL